MNSISIKNIIKEFNKSEFRRKNISYELVSGWPCICKYGKTLCMTIPYFTRKFVKDKVELYPIYCSVTIPLGNVNRIMDFTIYPFHSAWSHVNYSNPVGYFKHQALADVKDKAAYQVLQDQLYGYMDEMVAAIKTKSAFTQEEEMRVLFSKLMEPSLLPQYKSINQKFYGYFCQLEGGERT